MTEVLRAEGIAKRFGPVTALRDVNLHLKQGEVLGLLGDNGAGKSTLIKILCGYHRPDEGRILLDGEEVQFSSVTHARSLGIDTVYQDLALVDELSVFHNVFLNRELVYPMPFRLLDNRRMRARAEEYIRDIGVNIPSVKTPVARLSGGQRQAIAVARSVHSDAKIILLDEPLAAMGVKEGAMVLDLIARLRDRGDVSIVMILHNYVHVFQACDRLNLLRDGEIVLDKPTADSSVEEITEVVVSEYKAAQGSRRATHVVGIDFGTLSGRAVVVRASDGAELGSAVHEYAHGVIERELPATGERLPSHWALQDPEDYLDVLRDGGAGGGRGRGRRRGGRDRHRASTSPRRRRCRCCATARRCAASTASRGARTRT